MAENMPVECDPPPDDTDTANSPFSSGSDEPDVGGARKDLPACKLRRNYYCKTCAFCTVNPREYLYHLRDGHGERLQIYECSECVYASRGKVKLARHLRMVHARELVSIKADNTKTPVVNFCISTPLKSEDIIKQDKSADSDHSDVTNSDSNNADACDSVAMEGVEEDSTLHSESLSEFPDNQSELPSEKEHGPSKFFSKDIENSLEGVESEGCLKKKFFRCSKCDYTTHVRSRYSKHVRYHSMPMIKCELCEFQTPYKWNLDRHMKNHNNDGVFKCNVCTFSSQIKQSLTVHIQNHHLPHENAGIEFTGRSMDSILCGVDGDSMDEGETQIVEESIDDVDSSSDMHTASRFSLTSNGSISRSHLMNGESNDEDSGMDHVDSENSADTSIPKSKMELIAEQAAIAFLSPGNSSSGSKGSLSVLDQLFSKKLLASFAANDSSVDKPEKLGSVSPRTSSTRCQHCRHRCKCSDDLRSHLRVCPKALEAAAHEISTDSVGAHAGPKAKESVKDRLGTIISKLVYKCPNCCFWSVNAALFHVHWLGHLNMEPHQCSACKCRFNWSWDVTKHLDQKETCRNAQTQLAVTVLSDNAEKYCMYSIEMDVLNHLDCESEENVIKSLRSGCSISQSRALNTRFTVPPEITITPSHSGGSSTKARCSPSTTGLPLPPPLMRAPISGEGHSTSTLTSPKSTVTPDLEMLKQDPSLAAMDLTVNNTAIVMPQPPPDHTQSPAKQKQKSTKKATVWRCKKCNFKHPNRETVRHHFRSHVLESVCYGDILTVGGNRNAAEARQNGPQQYSGLSVLECSRDGSAATPLWSSPAAPTPLLGSDVSISVVSRADAGCSDAKFRCDICTFTCANTDEAISAHMRHHTPQNGTTYKCGLCPYYVSSHVQLVEHLSVHTGTEESTGADSDHYNQMTSADEELPTGFYRIGPPAEHSPEHALRCTLCPFSTDRHLLFAAHQQLHEPPLSAGLLHCPLCSFCAQQRPQLAQHVLLHGLALSEGGNTPLLADEATRHLTEIPLVWVSRGGKFYKMFKCRQCPHVNLRKSNIQEHERMHSDRELAGLAHRCALCNYVCVNAGVLSSHVKVHSHTLGTVHALVDPHTSDDHQLRQLCGQLGGQQAAAAAAGGEGDEVEEDAPLALVTARCDSLGETDTEQRRVLFFCQQCPARFFHQREIDIHMRFHGVSLPFACDQCNYTSRQRPHLLAHAKVHQREYADRSRSLLALYTVAEQYPPRFATPPAQQLRVPHCPPRTTSHPHPHQQQQQQHQQQHQQQQVAGGAVRVSVKRHACQLCPARFVKEATLRYHRSLHGCDAPFRCIKCDYAVKTYGNLTQHINLHIKAESDEAERMGADGVGTATTDSDFPMSGLDLFKRKLTVEQGGGGVFSPLHQSAPRPDPTRAADPYYEERSGNPDFTYPTVTDRYGRERQKRYKCRKCPSAFEKREQYLKHTSLHGVVGRFTCTHCDYAVDYYPNFCNHMKRHGVAPLPMSEASHRVPPPPPSAQQQLPHANPSGSHAD